MACLPLHGGHAMGRKEAFCGENGAGSRVCDMHFAPRRQRACAGRNLHAIHTGMP